MQPKEFPKINLATKYGEVTLTFRSIQAQQYCRIAVDQLSRASAELEFVPDKINEQNALVYLSARIKATLPDV